MSHVPEHGSERRFALLQAMDIDIWQRRAAQPAHVANVAPLADSVSLLRTDVAPLDVGWNALRSAVQTCTRCGLHAGRQQAVFGVGPIDARWMIIGEAPGADEDRTGEPFVGRSGKLLNEMLLAIGLQRTDVYIANAVKCRPPGNRPPEIAELAACAPWLQQQIETIQPRIILAVGGVAAHRLLDTDVPVGKLRGTVHHWGARHIPLVVTYHPSYLLQKPSAKRKSWDDLCLARSLFADISS